MLTIPQEVKDLLHLDSCKKNIRIHFLDGKRQDICNNLIVKNSVSFKESICSQDTVKFGLCESSVFECETTGSGNIKGARIEVFCEVFCDSTVDGAEWRSDLEAYVYSIPYGSFTVDSCKRQGNILHRKIIAYGGTWNIGTTKNKYELLKAGQIDWSSDYTPKSFHYAIANANLKDLNIPEVLEKTTVTPTRTETEADTFDFVATAGPYEGKTLRWTVSKTYNRYIFGSGGMSYSQTNNLFKIRNVNDPEKIAAITDLIIGYGGDIYGRSWVEERASAQLSVNWTPWSVGPSSAGGSAYDLENPPIFYGYMNGKSYMVASTVKHVSQQITNITDGGAVIYEDSYDVDNEFTKYSVKAAFSFFDSITETIPAVPRGGGTYEHNLLLVDDARILRDCVELIGLFGNLNRFGEFEFIDIKRQFGLLPEYDLYPGDSVFPLSVTGGKLLPEDYQTCWYDDEYTRKYGAVRVEYKNTNNDNISLTFYLPGYSDSSDPTTYEVYNLAGNQLISLHNWTSQQMLAICSAIADHINNVSFMPVEFKGRGLPYVEAGDTFEILTKSNESITTIVLNRTLTGELTLTDLYKSNGSGLQKGGI